MLAENLKDLLQQPMDRKDFIKHVGVGLIALTGITTLVSSLAGRDGSRQPLLRQGDDTAYGATTYSSGQNPALGR